MRQMTLAAVCGLAATTARGTEILAPGSVFPAWTLVDHPATLPGQAPQ